MGARGIGVCGLAVAVGALVVACSSGAGSADAAFTLDELRAVGDTCPVDLPSTGLAPDDAGEVEVTVVEGAVRSAAGASALDRVSGVQVLCRLQVDGGGDVTATVLAIDQGGAVTLVLPDAQRNLRRATDDLDELVAAFDDAEPRELLDLGPEAPVAIAPLDVEGAESAVFYLSALAAAPDDVRHAAERILDDL